MESSNKRPRRHVTQIEEEEEGEAAPTLPRKRREGGGDHHAAGHDDNEDGDSRRRVERAVTEAEVEEFYAILQSVREARLLGGKARRTEEEEIWQPQFAWEDFQFHAGCIANDSKNKTTAAAAAAAASAAAAEEDKIEKVFDLNVQPTAGIGDY